MLGGALRKVGGGEDGRVGGGSVEEPRVGLQKGAAHNSRSIVSRTATQAMRVRRLRVTAEYNERERRDVQPNKGRPKRSVTLYSSFPPLNLSTISPSSFFLILIESNLSDTLIMANRMHMKSERKMGAQQRRRFFPEIHQNLQEPILLTEIPGECVCTV